MCHVLIIEDEILLAMELQDLLEGEGADTFSFAATEAAAIAAARTQRPDFIISDVMLLEGLGPRAVEIILQESGPIPVVFITGTPEDCEPLVPPTQIFRKPISHPKLVSAFTELVPLGDVS